MLTEDDVWKSSCQRTHTHSRKHKRKKKDSSVKNNDQLNKKDQINCEKVILRKWRWSERSQQVKILT